MASDDRPAHRPVGEDPFRLTRRVTAPHEAEQANDRQSNARQPRALNEERLSVVSEETLAGSKRLARHDTHGATDNSDASPPATRAAWLVERLAGSGARDDALHNKRIAASSPRVPPRRPPSPPTKLTRFAQSDRMSRLLVYGAAIIGTVLALIVGVRSLLDGHRGEIAIIAPPEFSARIRPDNPGGLQVLNGIPANLTDFKTGQARLAPGPEQPRLSALTARYEAHSKPSEPALEQPNGAIDADQKAMLPLTPVETRPTAESPSANLPIAERPGAEPQLRVAETREITVSESPPAGQYYVQLGAVKSADVARKEWARIMQRMGSQLNDRPVFIVPKRIRGEMLYRIWAGGYTSEEQAKVACNAVRAQKLPCYAVHR